MDNAAIRAASVILNLDGRAFKMDFDLMALSVAEMVYRQHYEQQIDTFGVIQQIFAVQTSAIMAMAYGAMVSAGEKIAWEDFAKRIFSFANFDAIANTVADGVGLMFADPNEDADEDDPKNAPSRGAN